MKIEDEKDIVESLEDLSIKQKNLNDGLKSMKENLAGISHAEVLQYVDKNITADEKNTLVKQFYDAFRDVEDADEVKFECMELLAYIGIQIYDEKDFVPYISDNTPTNTPINTYDTSESDTSEKDISSE